VTRAPHNKQLQRTVMDKVPSHIRQFAAAELRRYAYLTQFLSPLAAALLVTVVGGRVFAQEVSVRTESDCPVSYPNEDGWFTNEVLKTAVPGDAPVVFEPGGAGFVDHDGGLGIKWAWIRLKEGRLFIGGRRLDGDAAPARAYISDGYGGIGFQPVYLVFPTPGCWEITGAVRGSTLTFVLKVERVGEGPDWRWRQGEMPAPGWRVTSDWREQ